MKPIFGLYEDHTFYQLHDKNAMSLCIACKRPPRRDSTTCHGAALNAQIFSVASITMLCTRLGINSSGSLTYSCHDVGFVGFANQVLPDQFLNVYVKVKRSAHSSSLSLSIGHVEQANDHARSSWLVKDMKMAVAFAAQSKHDADQVPQLRILYVS